jgi:hypothetical protein
MKENVIKIMLGWIENNEPIETTADKLLDLFAINGSRHLLNEMYEELRIKAKEGFESPQELWINADHQNAILCVMRIMQKREAQ